jgi:RNA polymerase sigma-70 factor (ECF subfamily)
MTNATRSEPDSDRGAARAIEQLLDQHGGRIYNLGLRLCASPETAEDLVQETFLSAYRHWHQFEGRANPSTWLYTIAARACQRLDRRRAGEPRHIASLSELLPDGEDGVLDLPDPDSESPLDALLRQEAQATVARAIAELPPDFRIPLVLQEVGGLPLHDIALALDLKEATVKTRVHRARLALRKALSDDLPHRTAPPPDHDRQVCLDLLGAKLQAMDRGVPLDLPPEELCQRCESLLATLDLAHRSCLQLGQGELPPALRQLVLEEIARAG